MDYRKQSTVLVPDKRWQRVDMYLFNRFIEMFGTDEELAPYILSWTFPDKDSFYKRNVAWDGVISVADYQEFLDNLINTLPAKYRKKEAKRVLPIIDLYIWPKTFELAELERNNTPINEKEPTNELLLDTTKS